MQKRVRPHSVSVTSAACRLQVDGVELAADPHTLIAQGRLNRVPLLAGVNTDEGTALLYYQIPTPLNASGFERVMPIP